MSIPRPSSVSAAGEALSSASSKSLANLAKLELSDGSNLQAKLVVGADGSDSRVRELAGIRSTGWNYSQSAVICTVEHAAENFCVWQGYLPDGQIALLPIGDNFSNIVWINEFSALRKASNHKIMNDNDFVKAINHALDYGYGPRPESQGFDRDLTFLRGDVTSSFNEGFEPPPKVMKVASERMAFRFNFVRAPLWFYQSKPVVFRSPWSFSDWSRSEHGV